MRTHRTPTRRALTAAAVASGLAALAAAAPAPASAGATTTAPGATATTRAAGQPTAPRTTTAAADLDDLSGSPAYRAWYAQRPSWAASTCPADAVAEAGGIPMECARVQVPRDWYHADRGSISVMISRVTRAAGTPAAPRLLLTNPGGPGGTGLSFGPLVASTLGVDRTHDVVGMDPRGVGGSTRATCLPPDLPAGSFLADGDARTVTRRSFLVDAGYRAEANVDCVARLSGLAPYLTSDQTARDLDLVRAVLGYPRTDYYGVSYGSWLGSVLARSFPSRVDRVVLDGNMDWGSGSMERAFGYQPHSFQGSYDRAYLPFLARHSGSFRLGSTPRAVDATVARVRVAASDRALGDLVTPDVVDGMLAVTQYTPRLWGRTGAALGLLDAARRGDRSGLPAVEDYLVGLFDSPPEAGTVQLAVTCNDTRWSQDPQAWYDRYARTARHLPLTGATYLSMSCHGWPLPAAITPALLARPVAGVLMLDIEGDPATAYQGAWATHRRTPGTRSLVVDDGVGHGAALAYECARRAAQDYLEGGVFPAADAICQAEPHATTLRGARVADDRSYELYSPLAADGAPSVLYTHRDLRPAAPHGVPTVGTRRPSAGSDARQTTSGTLGTVTRPVTGPDATRAREVVERAQRSALAGLLPRTR